MQQKETKNQTKERKKKVIGIFGGSFNPPTTTHFKIAQHSVEHKYVDECWLVPCGNRKDKPSLKTPGHIRKQLLGTYLVNNLSEDCPILIDDIELQNKNQDSIPTYYLMKHYVNTYPDYDFWLIFGSDCMKWVIEWDFGEKLLQEFKFLIYLREGYPLEKDFLMPKVYKIADNEEIKNSISSTDVRKKIQEHMNRDTNITENKDLLKICPGSVVFFIRDNDLQKYYK